MEEEEGYRSKDRRVLIHLLLALLGAMAALQGREREREIESESAKGQMQTYFQTLRSRAWLPTAARLCLR